MSRVDAVRLGWVLLHFLWQGAALALAAALAAAILRRARPQVRYAAFCATLAAMAAAPAVTWIVTAPDDTPVLLRPGAVLPLPAGAPVASEAPPPADPVWPARLAVVWMAGVAILSVRSLGGWVQVQRLTRRETSPAGEAVERAAAVLARRLGIRSTVRVVRSGLAEVPAAVGWLRPVVLVPIGALTALTTEQIELLLAHELAHVRRRDYLVNLLQTAAENLLFYHPAVWWVSGRIRVEREHCCDDLAVATCGDAVAYAKTLAALEGLRSRPVALAVSSDGGSLLARVERLLRRERRERAVAPAWLAAFLPAAAILASIAAAAPQAPEAVEAAARKAPSGGYLAGLVDAGYAAITIDEVIALKQHGVEPRYVKQMLASGMPIPGVDDMIRLHDRGVAPSFVAAVVASGLVSGLEVDGAMRLADHGVNPQALARIRTLGFGPYPAEDVVQLQNHGAGPAAFEALKEAGLVQAGAADAVRFQENGVSASRIREMKRQGFESLSLEQIVKLCRAGII